MKILVIVDFREDASSLRDPSSYTGVYGLVSEDEKFLAFDGQNWHRIQIGNPLWIAMEEAFFSQWRTEKWRMARYPNKEYRPLNEILSKYDHKSFDRIIFWRM